MTHPQASVDPAAVSRCYSSLGLRFRLQCPDAELARRFAELYAACSTPDGDVVEVVLEIEGGVGTDLFELRANDDVCCRTADRDELLEWCAWRINRSAVEQYSAPHLLVHAAAAARGTDAVLLAGPSGSGKSTLVTALTRAGLAYMGDDAVAVGVDGARVWANPKPIALDDRARIALLHSTAPSPELERARALVAPMAIGPVAPPDAEIAPMVVIRPEYRADAGVRLAQLTRGDVAELLVDQSFNFAGLGGPGLRTVAAVARATRGYSLVFGDLPRAVETVLGLLP